MQIHVVKNGETLNQIANMYSVSPQFLAESNKIPDPNKLVVGQTIVIPINGSYYFVQPGDSLYSIGNMYNVNYLYLANINGIDPNNYLPVGFRLYIPPMAKTSKETNAYIEPYGQEVAKSLETAANEAAPLLTYLAPFSYEINDDGTLKPPLLNNFKAIAEDNNATLMMVVTNLRDGQFDQDLGRLILTDPTVQNKLLDEIVRVATENGFRDVHFDMEFLPIDLKEDYNEFLRKAKARLEPLGILMSTALAPKTSSEQKGAWYEAHDYKAHGEIADFVVLMTYEWGYSGGPPLPVSPIQPVREVVEYALTEIPASKIMLGQNLYGYDWTLPFVEGGEFAKAISPQRAIEIASENNATIQYDYNQQAPFIEYTDSEQKDHIIWFEDARSIQTKLNLIKELGLRGISYWKLGFDFPQNWLLIADNFDVIKQ